MDKTYTSDLIKIDANTARGFGAGGYFVAVPATCYCCGKPATHFGPVCTEPNGYCDEHAARHDARRAWGQSLSPALQEQWVKLQQGYDETVFSCDAVADCGSDAIARAEWRCGQAKARLSNFEREHASPAPTFAD